MSGGPSGSINDDLSAAISATPQQQPPRIPTGSPFGQTAPPQRGWMPSLFGMQVPVQGVSQQGLPVPGGYPAQFAPWGSVQAPDPWGPAAAALRAAQAAQGHTDPLQPGTATERSGTEPGGGMQGTDDPALTSSPEVQAEEQTPSPEKYVNPKNPYGMLEPMFGPAPSPPGYHATPPVTASTGPTGSDAPTAEQQAEKDRIAAAELLKAQSRYCLLYTSPSPRD